MRHVFMTTVLEDKMKYNYKAACLQADSACMQALHGACMPALVPHDSD